jgi:Ca2+-binding EF-hand superfamily protein
LAIQYGIHDKILVTHVLCCDQIVAESLSEEEIMGLREMFKSLDTDNSGTITLEELRAGLPKLGTKVTETEIRQLMEAVCLYIVVP